MTGVLKVEGVVVELGGLRILHGVDLSVAAGERRVILGPNGAGKTTLFNVLTGMARPVSGVVRLHGEDVTRWSPHRRAIAGLGRTFQVTNLMSSLTVRDNVALAVLARQPNARRNPLRPFGRHSSVFRRADDLLGHWGLHESAGIVVDQLSYGKRRHLEIVVAVASGPSVLLLDEPTAGLSPADTHDVMTLIEGLKRTLAVVVIEHDLTVAFHLADTVTVLTEGQIHAEGSTSDPVVRDAVDRLYVGSVQLEES